MGGNTRNSDTLTEAVEVRDLRKAQRIYRLYIVRQDFGEKELELVVNKLKEVFEGILDRAMEDERKEDPGIDLSTNKYNNSEDEAKLNNTTNELTNKFTEEINEGIVIKCLTERNRLVKVLGM